MPPTIAFNAVTRGAGRPELPASTRRNVRNAASRKHQSDRLQSGTPLTSLPDPLLPFVF